MHRPDSPLFKNSIDTFPERILYLQRLLQKKFLTYTLPPEPTEPLKLLINASGRQFLSIQSSPYLIICLCQIVYKDHSEEQAINNKKCIQSKATCVRMFPANFPARSRLLLFPPFLQRTSALRELLHCHPTRTLLGIHEGEFFSWQNQATTKCREHETYQQKREKDK